MFWRLIRKVSGEPLWWILLASLIAGAVAGDLVARVHTDEAENILGHAWLATAKDARAILTTLLGLQLTLLTIVMSLNAPMIQSAANQYSPRLVPFYLRHAPIRQAFPMFVLAGAYNLAAIRQVGMIEDDVVRPQFVLTGAVVLVIVAFGLLAVVLIKTFRFLRVERVLALVRDSAFAAADRVSAYARGLEAVPADILRLPGDAVPIHAPASGYLTTVDVPGLLRLARRADVRVRICREIGDYVDAGELVGWVQRGRRGALEALSRRLAGKLSIEATRQDAFDPLYALRILADVATRALSSSSHDGYTSRQALHQIRSVLRRLAAGPLGDWNILDQDGAVRISIMAPNLLECVSAAIEAPLRHGAGDPEVLDGMLEIALEIGLIAKDATGRAVAYQIIARVLDDSAQYGNLHDGRLERLLAEAELVRTSLQQDGPRAERHVRANWTLSAHTSEAGASNGEARP